MIKLLRKNVSPFMIFTFYTQNKKILYTQISMSQQQQYIKISPCSIRKINLRIIKLKIDQPFRILLQKFNSTIKHMNHKQLQSKFKLGQSDEFHEAMLAVQRKNQRNKKLRQQNEQYQNKIMDLQLQLKRKNRQLKLFQKEDLVQQNQRYRHLNMTLQEELLQTKTRLAILEKERKGMESLGICVVCRDLKSEKSSINCGHLCLCSNCVEPAICPLCRIVAVWQPIFSSHFKR